MQKWSLQQALWMCPGQKGVFKLVLMQWQLQDQFKEDTGVVDIICLQHHDLMIIFVICIVFVVLRLILLY